MIQEKQKLSGNLNTKQSLNGSLNNAVIYVDPITQEKEITPSKQVQEVVPDTGFTGLSKVIVKPYTPVVAKKKISTNGIYKAADDNLDGYSEVEVATSGVDLNDYFNNTLNSGSSSDGSGIARSILKIPNDMKFAQNSANGAFLGCSNLTEIPLIDTSNIITMYSTFSRCSKLTTIPLLNTSKLIDMTNTFDHCTSLISIPLIDTSNVTHMDSCFSFCSSLTEIPQFNTSKMKQMQRTFSSCNSLTSVPRLDASNITSIYYIFNGCNNLTNFGGFQNLGQAYSTTQNANYSSYTLDLSVSQHLTHDSFMNVINNLYDIKNKGCKTQKLVVGIKNIEKLTAEEIAIATEKGWTVS